MSASAIVMMTVAMALFWGGLAWSILRLRNRPELED